MNVTIPQQHSSSTGRAGALRTHRWLTSTEEAVSGPQSDTTTTRRTHDTAHTINGSWLQAQVACVSAGLDCQQQFNAHHPTSHHTEHGSSQPSAREHLTHVCCLAGSQDGTTRVRWQECNHHHLDISDGESDMQTLLETQSDEILRVWCTLAQVLSTRLQAELSSWKIVKRHSLESKCFRSGHHHKT